MSIEVWVGNLGMYNEGKLVGATFTLPMAPKDIEKKLHDEVKIGCCDCFGVPYEEYAIFDYEHIGDVAALGFEIGQYEPLHDVNLLAAVLDEEIPDDSDLERIGAYVSSLSYYTGSLAYANYIMQRNSIPCYPYNYSGNDEYERFGRMYFHEFMNDEGRYSELDCYINFRELGKEKAQFAHLESDYWIDATVDGPDPSCWTREEIARYVGFEDEDDE